MGKKRYCIGLVMDFINKYLGLDSVQLNSLQITLRIIIVVIAFLIFIKVSGVHLLNQKKKNTLGYLITAIVVFILVSSIFTVNSFSAYLTSIFVFAILLRISNLIALNKNIKQKDDNLK